jgi:hypothetical protein
MKTMKLAVLLSLMSLAPLAFCQEKHESPAPVTQTQTQTANGGQATASSSGQTNSQVSEVRVPHQAPAVLAPDVFPTAPCRVAVSVGGSFVMGGAGVGVSKDDKECEKRETARLASALGLRELAVKLVCSTKVARKEAAEECERLRHHHWTEENSITFPN